MVQPKIELVASIPAACTLGEGPVWDGRTNSLWFTDIQEAQLLRLDWPGGSLRRFALPERLGSLGLTARPEQLICAFASGFALFEPETGKLDWLCKTHPEYRGVRMNDGRIDRVGRFWAGSMVEDAALANSDRGVLYRLDSASVPGPQRMLEGISISNSICFSPGGDRLYFADTPTRQISVFPCDPESGTLGEQRIFALLSGDAFPDGSDVDAAGRVWNAEWGSGRVTAYSPEGTIFAQIDLPVSQATCVAFGGTALDHLFVTTAREGLSAERLSAEPLAGDVLVFKTGVTGLPAPLFGA